MLQDCVKLVPNISFTWTNHNILYFVYVLWSCGIDSPNPLLIHTHTLTYLQTLCYTWIIHTYVQYVQTLPTLTFPQSSLMPLLVWMWNKEPVWSSCAKWWGCCPLSHQPSHGLALAPTAPLAQCVSEAVCSWWMSLTVPHTQGGTPALSVLEGRMYPNMLSLWSTVSQMV